MDAAIQGFFGAILGSAIAGVFTWRAVKAQIKEAEKSRNSARKQEWISLLRNEIILYMTATQKAILAQTQSEYVPLFHEVVYRFFSIELLLDQDDEKQKELFQCTMNLYGVAHSTYKKEEEEKDKIISDFLEAQSLFRVCAQKLLNVTLKEL